MTSDGDKIETMRVTTRGYELASTGVLPMSSYLRYLEHLRWTTIARSEKLPLRRFFMMGMVRAQGIEVFDHVSFDRELELTMWLSRLGKTSMDFSHDVTHADGGGLVARSSATIVAIGGDRRPCPIDDSARDYLVSRNTLSLPRLEATAAPEGAFQAAVHVRPSDHDLQQHVNHARYADFVEDARVAAVSAGAYGPGNFGANASSLFLQYEREARAGDGVTIASWASTPRSLDFSLKKEDGTVATRARLLL
jgi:acyl-CoA thioesterase FadM